MLSAVCGIYLAKLHNRAMTSVKSAAFADKLKVGSCPRETFYVSIAVPMAAYPVPLSTRKDDRRALLGTTIEVLVPLITLPYLSRVLGPAGLGVIGYAQTVAQKLPI